MSLQNLQKIGQLKAHPPDAGEIRRLLTAATRNLADYTGEDIDDSTVEHCIVEAKRLLAEVRAWLIANRPQLIAP
jgi:hypothetical protein